MFRKLTLPRFKIKEGSIPPLPPTPLRASMVWNEISCPYVSDLPTGPRKN